MSRSLRYAPEKMEQLDLELARCASLLISISESQQAAKESLLKASFILRDLISTTASSRSRTGSTKSRGMTTAV
jgi:hypothetical protein